MPEPDYQGFANGIATLSSPQTTAANVAALNQIQQSGAQVAAGRQIAAGNYLGGANTLYQSGNIQGGQQEQTYGGGVAGAQGLAARNYPAAAAAFGTAGNPAGVQGAQTGQIQQSQIVGAYLQQAAPLLHQAFAQNGAAGLVHAAGLVTQELTSSGLMTPAQAQQYLAQAGSDPQGLLSTVDNFVQQLQYQKVGDNSLLATNAFGQPKALVTGATQQTLNSPSGAQSLVSVPGAVTPIGTGGAPAAPPVQPQAAAPGAAPTAGPAPVAPAPDAAPTVGPAPLNNPGNLRPVGQSTGFMQFSSPQAGMVALSDDLAGKAKDGITTLSALANKYAPPGQNNTAQWMATVGAAAGISDPNAKIDLANPNLRSGVIQGIVKAEGNPNSQLSGAAPAAPAPVAAAPGTSVLASTATGSPLYRPATTSELPAGAVAAQINTATGQISNIINQSDVNNLTPATQKQLGDQYWLTGVMPNLGRGSAASVAMQSIQNAAQAKSLGLGLNGADDNLRHATVAAAQKTISTMLPQQAQLATAENNAIDNANQIRQLLPQAASTFGIRTLNDLQQAFRRETNNPQLAALDTALKDFTGDYAGVMFSNANGSGGKGGVSDRDEISELFNPSDSMSVVFAKLDQAQKGMAFRTAEFGSTLARMNQIARTGVIPPSTAAQPITGNQTAQAAPAAQGPQTAPQAGAPSQSPPPGAVQMLRSNPQLAAQFNQKYGPNASAAFLTAPAAPPPPTGQQNAVPWLTPGGNMQ